MNTLESDGKEFEMDSLMNSEPVQLLEVMRNMGSGVKVEDSSEGKVLDLLEFLRFEELVAKRRESQLSSLEVMIEWIKVSAASSFRCKKLSNGLNVFENDKRGGDSFRYV